MNLRLVLPALVLCACAPPGGDVPDVPATEGSRFEQGLLRDFKRDGKFDESGHPVNAIVIEAEKFCGGGGQVVPGGFRSDNRKETVCEGKLPKLPWGDLILNVRLRPLGIDPGSRGEVVRVTVSAPQPSSISMTGKSFRADGQWTYVPVGFASPGDGEATVRIDTFKRGAVEIDYIEIFANEFPVAFGPGSGVFGATDEITVEGPLGKPAPTLTVNGKDAGLAQLLEAGAATRIDTSYRTVYAVKVDALGEGELDLFARADGEPQPTARMHVYREPPACSYEGDPAGKRVLLTGFQPFPVAETHPNVSDVAVRALDVSRLTGAQVMRLTLPVEYDDAPAIVADAIRRCAPDVVIDFGQGSDTISLEHTAYNLKDTGNFVDNRGRFEAGVEIAEAGPDTLASALPLERIKAALEALPKNEAIGDPRVVDSTDPGRYVCNNTFYGAVTAAAGMTTRAGFIHLPYTTEFTDASRAAWGEIVRVAVQTAVDRAGK